MLLSLKQLLAHGEERVGVLFVVGEETNSDGAKAAAGGFAPKVKAFINVEPTDGIAVRAMKGVLAFELTAHGRAAHSAYPAAGHNAVHQLIDDLGRLLREPWPVSDEVGETTLNVGTIAGGVAQHWGCALACDAPLAPVRCIRYRLRRRQRPGC